LAEEKLLNEALQPLVAVNSSSSSIIGGAHSFSIASTSSTSSNTRKINFYYNPHLVLPNSSLNMHKFIKLPLVLLSFALPITLVLLLSFLVTGPSNAVPINACPVIPLNYNNGLPNVSKS